MMNEDMMNDATALLAATVAKNSSILEASTATTTTTAEPIVATASSSSNDQDLFYTILTYISLVIIGFGFVGNSISFVIFRFHRHFKSMPSMVYLSFISITDSLSLLVWNLDHYLTPNHGIKIERISELVCRISTFEQFVSLQSSALLLSMVTIDR